MEEGGLFGTFIAAKSRSHNPKITILDTLIKKPAVLSRFNDLLIQKIQTNIENRFQSLISDFRIL
jgi:hypothetical protein